MKTFDNFSGQLIDHDELDKIFQEMKLRQAERVPDAVPTSRVLDEPVGETWQCPRCGNALDLVGCSAYQDLWECAQCGYTKSLKQEGYGKNY